MIELVREARRAALGLAREPGLTATVVLTLALGVGANTALFTYLCGLMWPTVDAPEPEELVFVRHAGEEAGLRLVSHGDWIAYRDGARRDGAFESLAALHSFGASVVHRGASHHAWGYLVGGDYFSLFGRAPLHGRWLTPEDDRPGAPRVAVVGHLFWRRHLAADPGVVGETLWLDGRHPYTVVGVAPRGFQGEGLAMAVYVPLAHWRDTVHGLDDPERATVGVLGRLAGGVSREAAAGSLAGVARGLDESAPLPYPREVRVEAMAGPDAGWDDPMTGRAKVLMGVVALFLLLAAVNVANLLLARGLARRRDLAVRAALGASRWALARRLALESLLVAAAAGTLGAGLGYAAVLRLETLVKVAPVGFGDWGEGSTVFSFDGRMLAFSFAAALIAAFLTSAAPVWDVLRRDLVAPIRAGAVAAGGGRSGPRRALVVVQVALAAALLVGAGLLVRSLAAIHQEDVGYRIAGVHLLSLYFPDEPGSAPGKAELRLRRYDALAEEIRALPGVTAAALTARPPLFGGAFGESLEVAGRGEEEGLHTNLVDADYLETLGVPIVEGRGLGRGDRRGAPGAVVVNRTLADSLWPGQSALGKAFLLPSSSRPEERGQRFEVVGVMADHRYSKLTDPPGPLVYFPLAQRPRDRVTVLLRSEAPGNALATALRDLLRREHPALSVIDLVPLEEQVRRSLFEERLNSTVAGAVGLLGVALAALGLASLMAFAVRGRRREIGVRMAVGAAPADAVRLVLRQSAGLVGAGLVLGLLAALALGRLLAGMLYGVPPHDPLSLAAAAGFLGAAGLAAAWLPARSAARVDPAAVLRGE